MKSPEETDEGLNMASTPEAQPQSRSEPIPEMTEAYHKARRQFALFSGILMAWEYVGIKFDADVQSYWKKREPPGPALDTMRTQFKSNANRRSPGFATALPTDRTRGANGMKFA